MTLFLLLPLTLVLGTGALALLAARPYSSPALRHLMVALTLAVALLLPAARSLPPIPAATIHVSAAALGTFSAASAIQFDGLRLIWLIGVAALLLRLLAGLGYVAWQTRKARPWGLPGVDADIRLAPVSTPVVWGWHRPTILLPKEAPTWSPAHLRLVLLHEQAHVQRRDLFTALLALAAQTVYWFHPLVWWLGAQLRREQEYACDDHVLAAGVPPVEYADALLSAARRETASPALFGCAMISDSQLLKGRLMHILNTPRRSRAARWTSVVPVVLALLLVSLSLSTISAQQTPYKIGGDVHPPKLIDKTEPSYTDEARDAKIEGVVQLSVVINEAGLAENVQVIRTLDAGLDRNAVTAVRQWRFAPATKEGVPVPVQATIEVNFRLR